ncbi:hypothetical protein C8Q80DRAFT_1276637 [Daedaleopsis nitida]|nr:hypothetical protein C8Q80DRAFT_1276637 [Daedaleopsis nitida]
MHLHLISLAATYGQVLADRHAGVPSGGEHGSQSGCDRAPVCSPPADASLPGRLQKGDDAPANASSLPHSLPAPRSLLPSLAMFTSLAHVSLLLAAALAVLAAPDAHSPTSTLNDLSARFNPNHVLARSLPMSAPVPLTNAQRLARGLPPNRPRFHNKHRRAIQPRQSGGCPMRTGTIAVAIAGTNAGYVRHDANSFGEFGLTTDPAQALSVNFCPSASFIELTTLNGLLTFDHLGGVQGFASTSPDLGTGPFAANYVYIAGTTEAPRGPPISGPNAFSAATGIPEDYETTIWQLAAGDQLVPSWVNSDGSTPAVQLIYVDGSQAFALTGDLPTFIADYGPAEPVTFTFVQA